MTVQLLERAALSGRVDNSRGIIRGVKIIGQKSANGRTYPADVLRTAAPLYEGAKVYVDHGEGSRDPRSYADLIGRLTNVRFEAGALYGDLRLNLKHRLAEQLLFDAEHAPAQIGLSHDAEGEMGRDKVVKRITRVRSVDLVTAPATTAGLFESVDHEAAGFDWDRFSEAIQEDPNDFASVSPVLTGPEAIALARRKSAERAQRWQERMLAEEHPRDRERRLEEEANQDPVEWGNFIEACRQPNSL